MNGLILQNFVRGLWNNDFFKIIYRLCIDFMLRMADFFIKERGDCFLPLRQQCVVWLVIDIVKCFFKRKEELAPSLRQLWVLTEPLTFFFVIDII